MLPLWRSAQAATSSEVFLHRALLAGAQGRMWGLLGCCLRWRLVLSSLIQFAREFYQGGVGCENKILLPLGQILFGSESENSWPLPLMEKQFLKNSEKQKTNREYTQLCLAQVASPVRGLDRKKESEVIATSWTVACQAPPSMGFPRQEYWSGLPFPSPGDLPDPGIEHRSPTLQDFSL